MFGGSINGFNGSLTIRGTKGALILGSYRHVADFTAWTISKPEGSWVLLATLKSVDRFQVRQTPLAFAAPRQGGFWWWGIESVDVGPFQLLAQLGPPEQ
jgi:hypothetical protein